MNKSIYILSIVLTYVVFSPMMYAQDGVFSPPFDFPITFSGNFGEIRSNHFHGGLDFKTGGVIGKPVRALADGYVTRIRVTHGSGYVLEVVYDNGYTTICRHLNAFAGDMALRVEALQYEKESWEVDITPEPDEYPVKTGQVVAFSGNTGYSFGPHLHLDVLQTETGEYIDPLPFFKNKVKDTTAPRAQGIMLFPQRGKGIVNGSQKNQAFPLSPKNPVTAWGIIGIGIRAYDYMDGVHNKYGVHTVILEVDGKEVFRSVVDRFSYDENLYINSWTYGQYMKSFIDPGNRLRMLHAYNDNRGLVTIDEERPYIFTYTLKDALGNTSKVNFTIHGKDVPIPSYEHQEKYVFAWNKANYLQGPGLDLFIPKGTLYEDAYLDYEVRADSGNVALTYQLSGKNIPLHKACRMSIELRNKPLSDTTKYYVAGVTSKGTKYYVGGRYKNGRMEVDINRLATYTVAIDTVPPIIAPVDMPGWKRSGRIVIKADDKETGISSYRGTIDGKYALFGKPNSISGELVCELNPKYVKKGNKHLLEITVTDGCGNARTEHYEFVW